MSEPVPVAVTVIVPPWLDPAPWSTPDTLTPFWVCPVSTGLAITAIPTPSVPTVNWASFFTTTFALAALVLLSA